MLSSLGDPAVIHNKDLCILCFEGGFKLFRSTALFSLFEIADPRPGSDTVYYIKGKGILVLKGTEAIIYSMTKKERSHPDIINPSRKKRIAAGAGVDIAEVNRLMKQFEQSKKMMKQMSGMMGGKGKKRRGGGFKPNLPFRF